MIALIFRDLNASGELVAAPIGKPRSSEKSEILKWVFRKANSVNRLQSHLQRDWSGAVVISREGWWTD